MSQARGTGAGRAGMLALFGAFALILGACSLPQLPGRGGPDLTAQDVITLTRASAGMTGFFGVGTTEIAANTITMRYQLPNDVEISAVTQELSAEHRESIETAAQEYVAWERTLSEREHTPCTDIPSTGVTISGSFTHDSSVQDCDDDSPLRTLKGAVRDAQSPRSLEVARPVDEWTIEIRPWVGDGPDEDGTVERYELSAADHETGMGISAQNAPSGWGAGLGEVAEGGGGDGAPLGWDGTGTILVALNDFLQGQDQLGCGDPSGEVRVIEHGTPSRTWAYRLCPGQQSEALVEVLRAL